MRENEGIAGKRGAAGRGRFGETGAVRGEDGRRALVEGQAANRASRLRARMLHRSARALRDGATDGHGPGFEVEVRPPQRQQLASAGPGHRRQDEEDGEGLVVLLGPLQEGEHRFRRWRPDLRRLARARGRPGRRVLPQPPPAHALLQGGPHHRVDPAHRRDGQRPAPATASGAQSGVEGVQVGGVQP